MGWKREPAAERVRLGDWEFERRDDEIADLTFAGRRVLRSIRAVVRDRDWNTAAWRILAPDGEASGPASATAPRQAVPNSSRTADIPAEGRQSAAHRAGFEELGTPPSAQTLTLALRTNELGASIDAALQVSAVGDELIVRFDAVSRAEFETNRTGLVVLHPPQLAGSAVEVVHSDRSREATRFPRAISPHQPVFDITELSWAGAGLEVSVSFEGDVFEMEDQRNWTDASFKTYSRPLALPFPYVLAAGERVTQTIRLRAGVAPVGTEATPNADRIELRSADAFPSLRVGASTAPDPEPADIPPLGSALLVELDLASSNWRAALARAAARGLPLDVRVVVSSGADTDRLVELTAELHAVDVGQIAVFDRESHVSEAPLVAAMRSALASAGVTASVVGGSRSHFTELNRESHRLPTDLDGIVVTTTPLFHSLDTEQLVEAVGMQRLVAAQTVEFAAGKPVHVGPVTVRPRFNNVATGPQPGPTRADLADGYGAEFTGAVDLRQTAPELAAWTIASAAAFAVPGVASLTYFEEWGLRGIRSSTGDPYPVAEALTALAACEGGTLLSADSPDGLVWALGSQDAEGTTLLVANLDLRHRDITVILDGEPRAVAVGALSFERRRV